MDGCDVSVDETLGGGEDDVLRIGVVVVSDNGLVGSVIFQVHASL